MAEEAGYLESKPSQATAIKNTASEQDSSLLRFQAGMADLILCSLRISKCPLHSKAPSTAIDHYMPDDPFVQYEHLAKSWEHLGQSHRWKKLPKASQSKTTEAGVRKVSYSSETQCTDTCRGNCPAQGKNPFEVTGRKFLKKCFCCQSSARSKQQD